MRKLGWISWALVLALVGCGGSVTLVYDTISPTPTVTLDAGQNITLTANVKNDASNSGVNWSLTGTGALSGQTTTSVVYTAPATVATASTATVTAVPVKNTMFAAATQVVLSPALAFTTTTLATATVGTAYVAQVASIGGSGVVTYGLASGSLPAGLTLAANGTISGTPTAAVSSTFTVSATDQASTPVTATKTLTLAVTATTLVISTTVLSNGVSGTSYSTQLVATGGIAPYIWTVSSGSVPPGLSLSTAGVLSGTPSQANVFTFTAQVKDTEPTPQIATNTYTFSIYAPLAITTSSLPGGSKGNAYSATLAVSGGTSGYTWSLASGSSLPAGLTLSSAGVISGTPTTPVTQNVTVQVTDKSVPVQTTTATYSVTIVLSTLAIATTSLPAGTVGVNYSSALSSTGGNAPVTWSLASGSSLPAGLTLSSAGLISGKPTSAATTSFTVQATDATPATVSQSLSINVVALATLTLSTTSVPAGNIGTAYSTTLAATGGATPYTWSITSGALPAGLSLASTGVLSGIPVAAGSYTFTAQVADSQSTPATASRSFTLAIGTSLSAGVGNARLHGSYAFLLQGYKNGTASGTMSGFAVIGSLTADGNGNITGVEDVNAASGVQSSLTVSGTYTVGSDGRGLMVLTAGATTNVYAIATANLSGAVAQSVTLASFDNSTGASATTNASGFAKLQTASAFTAAGVNGTYVFGLTGESPCSSCASSVKLGPLATVGAFTSDGVATISAGAEDATAYGTNYSGITFSGSYTTPSASTGRGTLHVSNTGTLFAAPPTDYVFVVVNANELLLMSSGSHATTALVAGDARLQTIATYTSASLTGAMIGYESQANGGDGTTMLPTATNAILSRIAFTGSGTAMMAQDANRAGVFTAGTASAITYTTAAGGRTALGTQVFYPYAANAGFALDQAGSTGYGALMTYEGQASVSPLPPLLSGAFAAGTLSAAAPSIDASGVYAFTLSTGGVNTTLNGTLTTILDASTPGGTLTLGASNSLIYLEDGTGRITWNANGDATVLGVVDAISSTRAVGISTGAGATPAVIVMQK